MYVNHVYCQVSTILNCQLTYSSCQINDTILSPEVELRLLLDLKTPVFDDSEQNECSGFIVDFIQIRGNVLSTYIYKGT